MAPNARRLTLAVFLAGASLSLFAQGNSAADVAAGGRAFQNTCANCHGPDGGEIPGIDLGRGVFRRPMTDQDLVQVIRTGIPGTAMPANNMAEDQAMRLVAYLRSVATARQSVTTVGDAVRGKGLFEGKGTCAT